MNEKEAEILFKAAIARAEAKGYPVDNILSAAEPWDITKRDIIIETDNPSQQLVAVRFATCPHIQIMTLQSFWQSAAKTADKKNLAYPCHACNIEIAKGIRTGIMKSDLHDDVGNTIYDGHRAVSLIEAITQEHADDILLSSIELAVKEDRAPKDMYANALEYEHTQSFVDWAWLPLSDEQFREEYVNVEYEDEEEEEES